MNGDTEEVIKEVKPFQAVYSCAKTQTEKSKAVRGRTACSGLEHAGLDNIPGIERP